MSVIHLCVYEPKLISLGEQQRVKTRDTNLGVTDIQYLQSRERVCSQGQGQETVRRGEAVRGGLGKEESLAPKVQLFETPTLKGYAEDEQIAKNIVKKQAAHENENREEYKFPLQTKETDRTKVQK